MAAHPITAQILAGILRELPRDLELGDGMTPPYFIISDITSDPEGSGAILTINGESFVLAISHADNIGEGFLETHGEIRFDMGPNVLDKIF